MKYEEVDYINEDNLTTIKVKDYLPKKMLGYIRHLFLREKLETTKNMM